MKSFSSLWALFNGKAARLPSGVSVGRSFRDGGDIDADVCIVTNCAFVGGNAASTLTEFQALRDAGLSVVIVHCPVKRSPWKRYWVANRFLPYLDAIVPAHEVQNLRCRTLIARGPRMVMTRNFARFVTRITAHRALYIVNNSAWNEQGKPLFDWQSLHRRVANTGLPRSQIYPISPIIRAEGKKALEGIGVPDLLSPEDWPPVFKMSGFEFRPRPRLTPPIVIGRHARDHLSKWLEDPSELAAAYPNRPDIRVSIMGGADTAKRTLGRLPGNWIVSPFGTSGVEGYLADLDIFVYFPARTRDEAFGRTIIEAILSGLPVILPHFFEPTFGELALYCEPQDTAGLIDRISAHDVERLHYVGVCRDAAAARFSTDTLLRRMRGDVVLLPKLDARAKAFRQEIMRGN